MVEPTACSPAAGWEKGQVENQVQTIRGRFFQPRLRFASLDELNGWLEAECRRWAERQAHPEQGELTVAQALEIERSALQPRSEEHTSELQSLMRISYAVFCLQKKSSVFDDPRHRIILYHTI